MRILRELKTHAEPSPFPSFNIKRMHATFFSLQSNLCVNWRRNERKDIKNLQIYVSEHDTLNFFLLSI